MAVSTIGNRIKEARETLGYTQKEFSAEIKIGQSTLAMLESGAREVNDRHITLICMKFGLSESWLKTGAGDMLDDSESRFARNMAKLQRTDNQTIINLVNAIAETNPDVLVDIEKLMKKILGIEV